TPPKAPTPRPTGAPEPEVEELEPLPPEETSPSVEVKLDAIAPKSAPPAEERVADAAAPSEAPAKKPKKSSAVVIRGMVRVSEFPNQGSQPPAARAEFDGERTPFDGPPAEAIPLARVDAAVTPGVNDVPKAPRLPDAETLVNAAPFDEPSVEIELDAEDEVDDASGGVEEVVELDATLEMPRPSSPPPPPSAPRVEPPAAPAAPAPAVPAPAVPAAPAEQPRRKAWFETFFNDDYLRTVQPPVPKHVERECDFIERALDLAPGATILDVACGLGLHAMELNRRGYTVAAIDLSESMLSRARDEAKDLGLKVQFLHGDMQEMVFDIQFDAVVCWGTSFGYFDDDKNRQVIQRLHAALKPRGVLLLDVVNRDHVIQQQPNLVWFEGDGCVCMEESKFNYFHSRLQVKRTVILDDGRQRENGYSLRLYSAHELGKLLHTAGFRVTEFSGRIATPGVYFGAASPRMMIVAERRANATKTMPEVPSAEGPKSSPTNPALADTGEVTPPPAPPSSPAHPALAGTGEVTPPPAPPSSPAHPALADTGEVTPPPAPPSSPAHPALADTGEVTPPSAPPAPPSAPPTTEE
ncbi:MAG: methyltransferase domain-containing protein, partial [Myxococcota bacterium]